MFIEERQQEIMNVIKVNGKIAVEKIRENDTVYLTGGSFGHIMVSFLPRSFHYTVVVNNVDLAKELRSFDNIDVYIADEKNES